MKLWEAHLFATETEVIYLDRPSCQGGHELRLFVSGRPAGFAPRPYTAPGTITNGGGVCDYAAGPRVAGSVDNYAGSSLSWSGPAGIVIASGSVNSQTLTEFVRSLRAVSRFQWITYAKQAPHRSSQGNLLGPNA